MEDFAAELQSIAQEDAKRNDFIQVMLVFFLDGYNNGINTLFRA